MKFPHDHARSHVTGEAIYVDDRTPLPNEVWVEVVGTPVRSGIILSIDASEALAMEHVIACFTASDLTNNRFGNIVEDQPLLVEKEIGYIDEPVALLVGTCQRTLRLAKKKIKFHIDERPAIASLDQAIAEKQVLYTATVLNRGDVDQALLSSPHQLSGIFESGGQEHFYLESQAAIAYPLEDGQMEVHCSSQHPTETQHVVAKAIGVAYHNVVCIVKRMGGGFGGKESQAAPFAAYAALVAHKLKRPARVAITKDDDMMMTGKRHPFKSFYEVGFDAQGLVLALKIKFYSDTGAYIDLSPSILDRALFHADGCYYLENVRFEGQAMKTNFHSHTAFRGFGGPQGNMVTEVVLDEIAHFLKKDSYSIRERNLYQKSRRNLTPYGQKVEDTLLPDIFLKLKESSQYDHRVQEIAFFNQSHRFKKRALAVSGCKFGIAFTARFLNQGNALVNVHLDGTVQVSTGGTEMGQGLNTKVAQVTAMAFGLCPSAVKVMATSTEKNHNTSPTAASSGSDINGAATLEACEKIKKRLAWVGHLMLNEQLPDEGVEIGAIDPHFDADQYLFAHGYFENRTSRKKIEWTTLLKTAYLHRISLGDYSFYKTPSLSFDKKTGLGTPFYYFTLGAAVSEVEVDRFTGEYKVLRTDILMDLGRPINEGIDRGQVAGAFVQAMGWVTTESLFYADNGRLLSHSPTTYKIPNIQDTPRVFNIELMANDSNHKNILGSKAVGEPPFLLGTSVFLAIKKATQEFNDHSIKLFSPATPERVFRAIHEL